MQLECELPHLLLRVDADPAQGAGHLKRCLALAASWQRRGGQATFLSCCLTSALRQRIETLGIGLVEIPMRHPDTADLMATLSVLEKVSGDATELPWVVLDGHHFDAAYQSLLRSAGCRLLVIDDTGHLSRYNADMILNCGLNAQRIVYNHAPDTLLLLGTRFGLLGPEFQRWQGGGVRHCPEVVRKVIVTLEGRDENKAILKVIEALKQISIADLEVRVVTEARNRDLAELHRAIATVSSRFFLETQVTDTAPLMGWADLAVTAGETTSWEIAFMNVPAVILILAENQAKAATDLDEFGSARCLGQVEHLSHEEIAGGLVHLMYDGEARKRMSQRAKALVDGKGGERLLDVMLCAATKKALRLRAASQEDALMLWQWANDSVTRRNAFVAEPISWVDHEKWYAERIASLDTRFWILEYRRVPVGQIRYDRATGATAEINFSVAPAYRGKGFGTQLLRLTTDLASRELGVRTVEGSALMENRAATHAFIRAGFEVVEEKSIAGHACVVFRRSCLPPPSGEPDGAVR
jgi:UDP-2,4-diacetamido-2,4,6-trideoxy-beta-L-altropyranose hydrolase